MVSVKTISGPVERVQELVAQVSARFDTDDEAERQWLVDQCTPELADTVAGLSVQALHLIDALERADSINVVGLAKETATPKGTVSKALQRLTAAGLVRRDRREDNRKEVYVSLTPAGEEVARAHRGLHEEMGNDLSTFLARYSNEDLAVIIKVLEDLRRLPRDGLRFRPDLLD